MTIDNFNKIGKRPFRVNLQGDVEMAQGRTFDTQGSRIVNLPAPVSASEPQRAGDHVSHINIRAGGTGPTEVVINEELITQHGYNPEHTHVTVRFTQGGEKRVVLDTGAVGLLVTVYKSAAASSIVIEPGDGRSFRGSSAPVEVQPEVAAKRSFTIASIGDDWDFVGVPNIDGGVEGHMLASGIPGSKLADGSVTGGKIASGTVRNLHIATDADIDGSKLADGSVTGGKIKELSLFTDRLLRVGNLVSTNRELALSDLGCTLINVSVAPRTLTVPADAFPDGAFFRVYQLDEDGRFTIAADSGVTLVGATERDTYRPGDYITLTKLPAALFGNTWLVEANCSESGTYEPVISNTEHYAASTALGWWARTGKIVSVEVHITGSNTAVTTPKHVEISLPLPRILSGNFSGTNQVGGSASWGTSTTASISPAVLRSVNGAERVYINAADTDGSNTRNAQATFTYEL